MSKYLYMVDNEGLDDIDEVMDYIEEELQRYSGLHDDEIESILDEIEYELQLIYPDEPIILYGFTIIYNGGYKC